MQRVKAHATPVIIASITAHCIVPELPVMQLFATDGKPLVVCNRRQTPACARQQAAVSAVQCWVTQEAFNECIHHCIL